MILLSVLDIYVCFSTEAIAAAMNILEARLKTTNTGWKKEGESLNPV